MKSFKCSLITLAAIIFGSALSAQAAFFYVSTGGNDGNAGTEPAPFASIQKAVDTAQAGDTVKVLAGTYIPQNAAPYPGMIIFRHSGTAAAPITFEAVGSVVVKGDGGVWNFGGIFEISADQTGTAAIHDIIVRGFRLENSSWFGIKLSKANNILLENNYTYNTSGSGIYALDGRNITVRGNTLEKACVSTDTTKDTQEIISLSGINGFEVDHNHIFNGGITNGGNGGEGIDAKTGSSNGSIHHNLVHDLVRLGIYVDCWNQLSENIDVYDNTVFNSADGVAVSSENGGTTRHVRIFNNLLYNNRNNGVIVSAWAVNGVREDVQIVNNTIVNNGIRVEGQYDYGGGISVETANAKNVVIRNNILSQNKLWQILVNDRAAKITIDHNLFDAYRGYVNDNGTQRERRGKIYVQANPLFVDAANGNFRLNTNSPAINRGKSLLAPDKDFDSNPRSTNNIDLGAYESF